MRTLAIGDIHGCLTSLEALIELVDPSPEDALITLGDLVDRGPNSKGVIDFLIDLNHSNPLINLLGNHDLVMLQARQNRQTLHDWLGMGGDATLDSYSATSFEDIPRSHWAFLEGHVPYFEDESHFFVHANAYPDLPLENQPDYMLYWEHLEDPAPHTSGKTMICGHTSQKSGNPLNLGHTICIDTFAHGGGWLTCLDVDAGVMWQANEDRDTRIDSIENYRV